LVDKNEESTWQKVSASLDASAKIYAFRVDSVHSETYRFLGGLSRNETKNNNTTSKSDEESIDDEEDNNYNDLKKLSKKVILIFIKFLKKNIYLLFIKNNLNY